VDEIMGQGAAEIVLKPTVNIGILHGGLKVNMIPDQAVLEVDIRLPIGLTKEPVLQHIDQLVASEFEHTITYQVQDAASNPPSHCTPTHTMVSALTSAAEQVTGKQPLAIHSLGATDAKVLVVPQRPRLRVWCES